MARLWYPRREDVEVLARQLALEMFREYESAMPPFAFLDGEGGIGLRDSALALPRQTFDGRPLDRTVFDKGAVLLRSIIRNHPFVDGNKRLAVATTSLFLYMNGRLLLVPPRLLVEYALAIAQEDSTFDWREISSWLRMRCPYLRDLSKYSRAELQQNFGFTMSEIYRLASIPEIDNLLSNSYDR